MNEFATKFKYTVKIILNLRVFYRELRLEMLLFPTNGQIPLISYFTDKIRLSKAKPVYQSFLFRICAAVKLLKQFLTMYHS